MNAEIPLFGTDEMLSHAPALELARRKLAKLEARRDALLRDAIEAGSDGELRYEDDDYKALLRAIAEAEQTVSELERKEIA